MAAVVATASKLALTESSSPRRGSVSTYNKVQPTNRGNIS